MFRKVSLSIIRSLALYTQQQAYAIHVMLTACQQAVSKTYIHTPITVHTAMVYVIQVMLTACQQDPNPASKQSAKPIYIFLSLYIQQRYVSCSQHNLDDIYLCTYTYHRTYSNGICHTGLAGSGSRQQAVSIICMTYTYCCVYSARLLMMDRGTVRNMYSSDVLLTVHLSIFILVISQLDAQNLFYNKFISCLFVRRSKFYYTASGIITLIGGRPVHGTAIYRV